MGDNTNLHNLIEFAFELQQSKNFIELIKVTDIILKLNHKNSIALFLKGSGKLNIGKIDEAIMLLSESLEINPEYFDAYLERAYAFVLMGKFYEAIKDLDKILDLNSSFTPAYILRGKAYFDINNQSNALKDFNSAINLDKSYPEAFSLRADLYYNLEEFNKAKLDYDRAISIDKLNPNYFNNRGNIHQKLKNYSKAIQDFEKATKLKPTLYQAYNNLSALYLDLEYWELAIYNSTKAIEIQRSNTYSYINRAIAKGKKGDQKGAANDFMIALDLDPDNAAIYYNRAVQFYMDYKDNLNAFLDIVAFEASCIDDSEFYTYNVDELLQFFEHFEAPFFLFRMINRLEHFNTYIKYLNLIQNNLNFCIPILNVFHYIKSTNSLEKGDFELLFGVINYYFNDLRKAYDIFDNEVDIEIPNNLMGQYYFMVTTLSYRKSEKKAIFKNVQSVVELYFKYNNLEQNYLQTYYAGLIYIILNKYEKAHKCFSSINEYLPALCMEILCLDALNLRDEFLKKL